MNKKLILQASLFLAATTGAAFANEARVLDSSPVAATPGQTFFTLGATFDSAQTPAFENGTIQFDFDAVGDVSPQTLQADLEGSSWSGGLVHDLQSGWRVGMFFRHAASEADATGAFDIPNGTPYRYGLLDGTQSGAGNYGGSSTATQILTVDAEETYATGVLGRAFGFLRADLVASIGTEDLDSRHAQTDSFGEFHSTNLTMSVASYELVARVATSFALGADFNLGLAGSFGGAYRDIGLDVSTVRTVGGTTTSFASLRDSDTAYLGSLSGSLAWMFTQQSQISLEGGWTYDSDRPAYSAPNYAVGAPASIDADNQEGYYVGLRWGRRW